MDAFSDMDKKELWHPFQNKRRGFLKLHKRWVASIRKIVNLRFATDGVGSATKPLLVLREGIQDILFYAGRRGRLTCLIPALAAATPSQLPVFCAQSTIYCVGVYICRSAQT